MPEVQTPLEKALDFLKTLPDKHKAFEELFQKWEKLLASNPRGVFLDEPLLKLRNVSFLIREDCVLGRLDSDHRTYALDHGLLPVNPSDAEHMKIIRDVTKQAENAFDSAETNFNEKRIAVENSIPEAGNQAGELSTLGETISQHIQQLETQSTSQQKNLDQSEEVKELREAENMAKTRWDEAKGKIASLEKRIADLREIKWFGFDPIAAEAAMISRELDVNAKQNEIDIQQRIAVDQEAQYRTKKKDREAAEQKQQERQNAINDLRNDKQKLEGYIGKNKEIRKSATTEQDKLGNEKAVLGKIRDHLEKVHVVIHALEHLNSVPTRIEVGQAIIAIINQLTQFQSYAGVSEKLKEILNEVDKTCNWSSEEEHGASAYKNLLSVRQLVDDVDTAVKAKVALPAPTNLIGEL